MTLADLLDRAIERQERRINVHPSARWSWAALRNRNGLWSPEQAKRQLAAAYAVQHRRDRDEREERGR